VTEATTVALYMNGCLEPTIHCDRYIANCLRIANYIHIGFRRTMTQGVDNVIQWHQANCQENGVASVFDELSGLEITADNLVLADLFKAGLYEAAGRENFWPTGSLCFLSIVSPIISPGSYLRKMFSSRLAFRTEPARRRKYPIAHPPAGLAPARATCRQQFRAQLPPALRGNRLSAIANLMHPAHTVSPGRNRAASQSPCPSP
jgi:hypothetical protein